MSPKKKTDLTNDPLVARVRAELAEVSGVEEKRMFGSVAFMVRGNLCVAARTERILCRFDPAQNDEILKRDGVTAMVMRGRQYPGYVHIAAAAVNSKRELRQWIDLALAHNKSLPAK